MIKIYVDGGSRGNPGNAAIGVVIFDKKGEELYRFGSKIGNQTNNVAEYKAIINALEYLNGISINPDERILILSDSELLVRQINDIYKVKNQNLINLYNRVQELIKYFKNIEIKHINREKNKISDWIVNRVLDNKRYRPADWPQKLNVSEESPGS